ncbi:PhzF family phenazine biosynthesis protein [Dethiosulfovibrio salsuginis]|uniref:Phenazine biosynthesis-like protein n=1 Tax=Dethiosulfovibrio salsuginis TaxID=561720 RepID=A0A1X7K2R4_9BACT|nr:PhzF family phenazine biosynthesis protein [Dethiosulfovibrio salsuginis]SMG34858.1 Phenazine biosynthesis-like protein [Dethiosulfovibrio salsuginis]
MRQYVVDAFTDRVFGGNPAAVCVMERWLSELVAYQASRRCGVLYGRIAGSRVKLAGKAVLYSESIIHVD